MAKSKQERVTTAPEALRRADKHHLMRCFTDLVSEDRGNTASMIAYIGEIDRRKLYLEDAYPSMFALCTKHFGMSEAIAGKRIRAGRAACRFPCILDMVRRGEIHLSGIHQLSGYLTEKNYKALLRRAKHRSMREIDELIAEIAPRPDPGSMMRPLPDDPMADAGTNGTSDQGKSPDDRAAGADGAQRGTSEDSPPISSPASHLKNLTIPLSPRRYRLHVTIGQQARDALEELQNLLSHQIPNGDPALIVERALEVMLAETKKKRAAITKKPRSKKTAGKRKKSKNRTRGIPTSIRREVFARDEGRCAFIDASGRRCDSSWQLEFHHCTPFSREGPHSVENIELRCRAHNQYEAELEFGREFMERRRWSA